MQKYSFYIYIYRSTYFINCQILITSEPRKILIKEKRETDEYMTTRTNANISEYKKLFFATKWPSVKTKIDIKC